MAFSLSSTVKRLILHKLQLAKKLNVTERYTGMADLANRKKKKHQFPSKWEEVDSEEIWIQFLELYDNATS